MSFTVIQSGATLQLMNESGDLTPLTLPTGVTLRSNTPPRWTVFDRYAILVNTPDQPLIIDGTGTIRLLSPRAPRTAPVLSGVAGGALSGTYAGVRYTFITQDADGNIISESDYSPASSSVTIVTNFLKAANLDLSGDAITGRRLYRPTSGGATLFQWLDLDGNVLTEVQDDTPDASLSIVGAPTLGTPPYLSHIASFRGRLFGAGPDDLDHVRYTEAGIRYAWPADNVLEIPVIGSDDIGVNGFLQRRDALGVGRINQLVQITGTGAEDATSGSIDLDVVIVSKELGIVSQESIDVYRDVGYFLWLDGVYSWGPDGIQCLSDGANGIGQVRSWFASDSYFDRSRFREAFGHVDPVRNKYRLYLYAPDGTVYWVEFDLHERTWWGPHKTDLFAPSSAFFVEISRQKLAMVGGTDGNVYRETPTRTDGESTPIAFDVVGKRHDLGAPDLDKYFGQLSVFGEAQATGGLLIVDSRTGALEATLAKRQYYQMEQSRQGLGRLGVGKHAQLEFTHATAGEKVGLFGYEVDDVHLVGRR
jgi:hypothetical protein